MSSPHWDILVVVRDRIAALPTFVIDVDGNPAPVRTVIRDRLYYSKEHGDPETIVVVAPGKDTPVEYFMPDGLTMDWEVLLGIFQADGLTIQKASDTRWRIDRRWELFQEFARPLLPGVPRVFSFKYTPDPQIDLPGLGVHYKATILSITYRTKEIRGGAG